MIPASVAAPTGAAARVPAQGRTVAGRRALQRALQVVLLLGGLLVLGFLFGERAQAADGPLGDGSAPGRVQSLSVQQIAPVEQAEPVEQAAPVKHAEPVAPAVRRVAEPVAEPVVRPVGEAVREVAGGLRKVPSPSELVPEQPLPGSGDGRGPGSGTGAEPAPEAAPHDDSPSAHEHKHRSERPVGPRADFSYGTGSRHLGSGPATTHADRRVDPRYGATAGEHGTGHGPLPAPAHPSGSLGNVTAGHGDLHAAALDGRAPVRLLSGPGHPADSVPTRDRHRDIPEFPG